MSITCQVCYDKKATVTCPCGFETCAPCCKRYVLDPKNPDAHCMACKRAWTRDDMVRRLGKTFTTTTYKKHRENSLFEREKALLPETQRYLDNYRTAKNMFHAAFQKRVELAELKKKIHQLKADVFTLELNAHRHVSRRWESGTESYDDTDVIVRGCPERSCRGFLTSSNFSCGTCGTRACPKCHAKLGEEHACDPNDAATARSIQKHTKPCPKCHVPIFKVSGCYQMFCTLCHCVFDWNDGKELTTTIIHNPHYFEWLERRGESARNMHAVCGFQRLYDVLTVCGTMDSVSRAEYARLAKHVRTAAHVHATRGRVIDPPDNRELRLMFLDHEIDEKKFKTIVQRDEKRRFKENEIRSVLRMYVTVVHDLVMAVTVDAVDDDFEFPAVNADAVKETVASLDALETYVNSQLAAVAQTYSNRPLTLSRILET